ncbi:MAG: chemotaxis response regulator protein-glutamate methylesterase [Acidobacteriaceae bacterium]
MHTIHAPLANEAPPQAAIATPVRVLVVDDSVVIRRILSRLISDDPALEVIGFAANGSGALGQAARLQPDVITMDVEMPEMDGLAAVRALRAQGCAAAIIMCSTLTSRGARATIDALMYGADDYVTKTSNISTMGDPVEALRRELLPKIKQFGTHRKLRKPLQAASSASSTAFVPPRIASPMIKTPGIVTPSVVAIGISTGGPAALLDLLPRFPREFRLPIVIVQHMPPVFTRQLAERLNEVSQIEVLEGCEGMQLQPGRVLLAPGDLHMRLSKTGDVVTTRLDQGERENSCRPSVDVLFHSVAEVYGGHVIGVILTGMGQDGLRGVERLKQRGAHIIAQDRESSVVWGMPGAVVNAGFADHVVALEGVGPAILERVAIR